MVNVAIIPVRQEERENMNVLLEWHQACVYRKRADLSLLFRFLIYKADKKTRLCNATNTLKAAICTHLTLSVV